MQFQPAQNALNVEIEGKNYKITRPTIGAMEEFQSALEGTNPMKMFKKIIEVGQSIGLPEEVVRKWNLEIFTEFLEFIGQQKKSSPVES